MTFLDKGKSLFSGSHYTAYDIIKSIFENNDEKSDSSTETPEEDSGEFKINLIPEPEQVSAYNYIRKLHHYGNVLKSAPQKEGPRGDRNNNPGNIRHNRDVYKGEVTSSDPAFKSFKDMAHGFRAMFKTYGTYVKNGYNTLDKLINRWAPAADNNNTSNYIQRVSRMSGIKSEDLIDPTNKDQMTKLAYAMATVELGHEPSQADVQAGWNLLSEKV